MESIELHEELSLGDARIDEANGVLRDVRILGRDSKNGRSYSAKALQDAAKLYEGIDVNIDHERHGGERGFDDAFGQIKNVRLGEGEVRGDLHYLKTHPAAPRLVEIAKRMPNRLGFSHHAEGSCRRVGGKTVVESVERMKSVDLVQSPATNNGLFESFLWEDGALLPVEGGKNLPPDAPGDALGAGGNEDQSDSRAWLLKILTGLVMGSKLSPAKLRSFVAKAVDLVTEMEKLEQGTGGAVEKPEGDAEVAGASPTPKKKSPFDRSRADVPESEEPTRLWANFVTGKHERITESEWKRRQRVCSFGGAETKTEIFEADLGYPEGQNEFIAELRYRAPAISTGGKPRAMSLDEQRERQERMSGALSFERVIETIRDKRPAACNELVEVVRDNDHGLTDRQLARLTEGY